MERKAILSIRRAVAADAVAILDLVPQLVEFGPPAWRDSEQMTRTDTAVIGESIQQMNEAKDLVVFVATLNEQVVAFVHVRAVADYYLRTPQAHVADLVVAPRARGSGIASRLLVQAEQWAKEQGLSQLTISVFERNADALSLYERRGFERETVRLIKPL